jgi:hypothetical protein
MTVCDAHAGAVVGGVDGGLVDDVDERFDRQPELHRGG